MCSHLCFLRVFELHSASVFLHFFESLFPRRSEPGSRPHSWHSTKLGEGPQDSDSMMQVTQGGVGAPWHQSYHSRSVHLTHKYTCSLVGASNRFCLRAKKITVFSSLDFSISFPMLHTFYLSSSVVSLFHKDSMSDLTKVQ